MNSNCCPVSVKAFNQTSQTVLQNGSLSFLNSEITGDKCCSIINNNAITLKQAGTYLITINANALATTADNLTLQLFNKGVAVPGAIGTVTATTTGTENIGFSTLITINSSCNCVNNNAILTLINTGVGATYSNVAINIIKVKA